MKRTIKPATGTARLSKGKLTITTVTTRRGKEVRHAVVYTVEDLCPDKRVADPAFNLIKEDGEIYHVAVEQYGPTCSCPHYTFRGSNSKIGCKHVLALMAVGLIPKEK